MTRQSKKRGRARTAVMTAAAVALGLATILGIGEMVCRTLPCGAPALVWPSPLDFQQIGSPALVERRCRDGSTWLIPAPEVNVRPAAIPKLKAPDAFRIIVFGGSAAYAGEFEPGGAWPHVMERLLAAAYPNRDIQVINLASVGHSSGQVLMRLSEALSYDPDLLIVYSGNNEALDVIGLYQVRGASLRTLRIQYWMREHSGMYRCTARLASRLWTREFSLSQATAVHEHRWSQDDWDFIAERYRRNLGRICEVSAQAGVPVIFSTLVNSEERANRPNRCFFCDSWMGPPASPARATGDWNIDWAYQLWSIGRVDLAYKALNEGQSDSKDGGEPLVRALIVHDLGGREEAEQLAAQAASDLERDNAWEDNPVLGARYMVALKLLGRDDRLQEAYRNVLSSIEAISPEDRLYFVARIADMAGDESTPRKLIDDVLSAPDDVIVTGRRLNPIVSQVAAEHGVMLIKPDEAMRRLDPRGRIGTDVLVDYCHFTSLGGHMMAWIFAQAVIDTGLLGQPAPSTDLRAIAMEMYAEPWERGGDLISLDRFMGVGGSLACLSHAVPNSDSRAAEFLDDFRRWDGTFEQRAWAADVRCRFDLSEPDMAAKRSIPAFDRLLQERPDQAEVLESAAICGLWAGRPDLAEPYLRRLIDEGDPNRVGRRLLRRVEAAR